MEQVLEFIENNFMIVAAWALTVAMLLWTEQRKAGKSVGTHEATRLINKEGAIVLDIRPKKEFSTGYITNAIHIPASDLDNHLTELEKYKQKPIIVVCNIGQTAGATSKKLKELGFENVVRLSGGMTEWKAQSLPVIK